MTWAMGAILYCLALVGVAAISLWLHGAPMRKRQRKREALQRYCRLEWR